MLNRIWKQSSRRPFTTIALILVVTLLLGACALGESETESTGVEAPTAAVEEVAPVAPTAAEDTATPEVATSEIAASETVTEEVAMETSAETSAETTETAAPEQTEGDAAASGAVTFTFVPETTEARFSIYELLLGQDKTVIGTTTAVEGSLTVDPADPASASIAPIRIDATTLATDSSRRNGAIQRWILESDQEAYQYIVFTPTSIEGLPAAVNVGDTFEFTVTGDLTIRDITNEETFTLTVTANSATELAGLGQTTITRGDYDLTIPSVPSVANVAEEVPLEIEFTAVAS